MNLSANFHVWQDFLPTIRRKQKTMPRICNVFFVNIRAETQSKITNCETLKPNDAVSM